MVATTTITYKSKLLIASGTFITFDEGETILLLEYKGDRVRFVFDVVNDGSDVSNSITSSVALPDTLRITIRNYKVVMGNAVVGPVALGEIAGRKFFMLLLVKGAKSTGAKLITYSLYIEEGE